MPKYLGTYYPVQTHTTAPPSSPTKPTDSQLFPSGLPHGVVKITDKESRARSIIPYIDPNPFPRLVFTGLQLQTEDIPSSALRPINPSFLQVSTQEATQKADLFLNIKADFIVLKTQSPPTNNKHDFFSLSPYYWPDSTKPNGLPYILHDGNSLNQASIPDKQKLIDMIYRVKMLSLAYHFTNDVRYATKARELIQVWFLNSGSKVP